MTTPCAAEAFVAAVSSAVRALSTALPDTNYAPVCSGSRSSIYLGYGVLKGRPSSTSACNIYFYIEDTYSGESATDGDILCVSIFR